MASEPLKSWKPPPGFFRWQKILSRRGLSLNVGKTIPSKNLNRRKKAILKRNLERPSLGHGPVWDSTPTVQEPTGGLPVAPGSSGTPETARTTPETMHGVVTTYDRAGRVKVRDAETT